MATPVRPRPSLRHGGEGAATTKHSLKAMINLLILAVIHNAPITIPRDLSDILIQGFKRRE